MRCLLLYGLGLLLVCMAMQAQARTLELSEARMTVTAQDQTVSQTVSLPYHWDRHHPGLPGEATFELPFELDAVPAEPYGLYLPRLGNAYEIWLNGMLLQRNGDLQHGNGADYAKAPRFVVISPGLLRARNVFRVHIRADVGRRGGLAPLTLGPQEEVLQLYVRDYDWRITGSLVVVIVSLLVGMMALALWATQVEVLGPGRLRRDPLYLFASLAELSWTLSVSDAFLENPPIPWPGWGMVALATSTVWICSMILFCLEVANWSRLPGARWLRCWLALLLLASAAASTGALVYGHPLAMTLLYAALGLTALIFVSFFIGKAVRGGAPLLHKMVAGVLLINTLVGLRDLYVFRISHIYGGNTLLRYSSVLFGLTLGGIVLMRFRAVSGHVRELMASLPVRVAQKEAELKLSYQRVEQLAREQERTAERTRILRDMHDGVGSHISTAIRQLESGRASQGDVLQTLRDSLDQLKLAIDAMHLSRGDITALLANLRYRLEPRFKASDIELQWDVDLLAPLERLDDRAMRQLQFMVFEAISNVLQHARASVLRIELRTTPRYGALLRVIDNGCGFDLERVKRKGLSSLRERATAIGAGLEIASVPGHTVLEIVLD